VPTCRRHFCLPRQANSPQLISSPNHQQIPAHPVPARGAFRDRHGRWERDAVDAVGARDECTNKRTAKSCGPDIPTLISSGRQCLRIAACDGGNKARLTEEITKETVKTIARGMPGDTGVTVVTMLVCFFISHTRLRAQRGPAFPAPSRFGGRGQTQLGRAGAARRWPYASVRACRRSGSRPSAAPERGSAHRSRASSPFCRCPCRGRSSGSDRRVDCGRPQARRYR
jgi:hypothetical protein